MRWVHLLAAALLVLSCCACTETPQQKEARLNEEQHDVSLVAIADDGTKLWRWNDAPSNNPVYFSSAGTVTSHDERHGKHTETVTDAVPAATP